MEDHYVVVVGGAGVVVLEHRDADQVCGRDVAVQVGERLAEHLADVAALLLEVLGGVLHGRLGSRHVPQYLDVYLADVARRVRQAHHLEAAEGEYLGDLAVLVVPVDDVLEQLELEPRQRGHRGLLGRLVCQYEHCVRVLGGGLARVDGDELLSLQVGFLDPVKQALTHFLEVAADLDMRLDLLLSG